MPTVKGRSDDPGQPGVLGTPMKFDAPGPDAIGVLGEGGAGFQLVIPPGTPSGRRAIGVMGTSADRFGAGVLGENTAGGNAGQFDGNLQVNGNASVSGDVVVKGDISLANGDCAEDFEIADGCSAEPGTVMVLHDESSLRESAHAYDKRVAGVIAGAGSYKPGIVLDRQHEQRNRKPVALLGKVFCKADAQFGSIGVGDLLTTSHTPGHAMRADDPLKAFGAVIGKALRPLAEGQGLIPILIALQ
jgi:hypothetical protein